jgi:cation transport ATPase
VWASIPLLVVALLGKYMEAGAKSRTTDVVTSLMGLVAKTATLLTLNPTTGENE